MKKELYTEAELEVVRFDNDDVITNSCTVYDPNNPCEEEL